MLKFKPGVTVFGLQPEILSAIDIANTIYTNHGADCVVTSTRYNDTHGTKSKHYSGHAVDTRTRNIPNSGLIADEIRAELHHDFDVLFESRGTDNEHIHIEFDPKGRQPYP